MHNNRMNDMSAGYTPTGSYRRTDYLIDRRKFAKPGVKGLFWRSLYKACKGFQTFAAIPRLEELRRQERGIYTPRRGHRHGGNFIVHLSIAMVALFAVFHFAGASDTTIAATPVTEKEAIVAEIKHEVLVGPKYTIRVGLEGARKEIPTLTGLSVDERAKQWLQQEGLIGDTLGTWKKLGTKYKINYTLPICIAWADSHLGRAMKSKNNIGNIGNNDRGHTKEFTTLDAGIESMFWNLAYGTYLGGHETIGTLSNEGRTRMKLPNCGGAKTNQKCYATSEGVWSTNVVNCLSAIQDTQVDEKWKFKI